MRQGRTLARQGWAANEVWMPSTIVTLRNTHLCLILLRIWMRRVAHVPGVSNESKRQTDSAPNSQGFTLPTSCFALSTNRPPSAPWPRAKRSTTSPRPAAPPASAACAPHSPGRPAARAAAASSDTQRPGGSAFLRTHTAPSQMDCA